MTTADEYIAQLEQRNAELEKEKADIMAASLPPTDNPLASEKNFRLMTGVDEIPAKYKNIFSSLLAASTQWMYIKDKPEEDDWVDFGRHHIRTWKMYNPHSGFTIADEQAVLIYYRRYLNRGFGGFERNGIITQIQQVNYQTQPIAPTASPKKLSLLERINPFRK